MTDKAIALFVRHLQGMTDNVQDQIDLINTAIERGWQTVYPSKGEQKQASGSSRPWVQMIVYRGLLTETLNLKEAISFDERRSCKNALRDSVSISADIFKIFCTGYYEHGFCVAFSAWRLYILSRISGVRIYLSTDTKGFPPSPGQVIDCIHKQCRKKNRKWVHLKHGPGA